MVHLIVDGYNLIRCSQELSAIEAANFERGRLVLIQKLGNLKNHSITVVFDAAKTENLSVEKDRISGVEILYTETGQSADEVIIDLASKLRNKALVVSSDREILKAAKSAGCAILESWEFEKILNAVGAPLAAPFPNNMFKPEDDEEPPPSHKRWITQKKGPSRRLPKAKRRALRNLKF